MAPQLPRPMRPPARAGKVGRPAQNDDLMTLSMERPGQECSQMSATARKEDFHGSFSEWPKSCPTRLLLQKPKKAKTNDTPENDRAISECRNRFSTGFEG